MNEAKPQPAKSSPQEINSFLGLTILIVIAAIVGWLLMLVSNQGTNNALPIGTKAPVIKAQGWVNGEAPTPDQFAGKVLFVEAWATWCLPCRMHAPEIVKDYEKFKDNPEVIFIGLTTDDESVLPKIQTFLKETNKTWLNGYGAHETLNEFKAEYIPAEWVIDRQGNIVWRTGDQESPTAAIERALAKK